MVLVSSEQSPVMLVLLSSIILTFAAHGDTCRKEKESVTGRVVYKDAGIAPEIEGGEAHGRKSSRGKCKSSWRPNFENHQESSMASGQMQRKECRLFLQAADNYRYTESIVILC